ncbi:GspE/PulE family protein [Acinetobacter bereziniae]|uniref:GspE/PulE family protein n=1 Tax=Acinetobacter bereziniae TaxID=106648 RepID=UPI001250180B|nr:GspE/PulE family protein [Acinetobacter bereziniae]
MKYIIIKAEDLNDIIIDESILNKNISISKGVCFIEYKNKNYFLFKSIPDEELLHWIYSFYKKLILVAILEDDLFFDKIFNTISYSQSINQNESIVIEFLEKILLNSLKQGASDIHFENQYNRLLIKIRLDGVLIHIDSIDNKKISEQIISRIKVLSNLDIAEQRIPQDGRLSLDISDVSIDLRISIMPGMHGEDAVLRILDKSNLSTDEKKLSLEKLGFDEESINKLNRLAANPYGMILFTGPTGSGKTTSLYSLIQETTAITNKIITIEDPIEYKISNALQIPVNEKKGLTFAKGLRSILRHDPDTILIGEIRDKETAEIAIQAALTGHLVYSSVHANTALDVIGRFRHMGVDLYGFLNSLTGIVAQRLIRINCVFCFSIEHKKSIGCDKCFYTGYKGRKAIIEILFIDDTLREFIINNTSTAKIKEYLIKKGMKTLRVQGLENVKNNVTTIIELDRVTQNEIN